MSDTVTVPDATYTTVPKVRPDAKNVRTINFVEDGLCAFGKVWYRGEELSIDMDSPSWKTTLDVYGASWLDKDEEAQVEYWGKRMFRQGAWQGQDFDLNATDEQGNGLTEQEKAELLKHSKKVAAAKKAAAKKAEAPKQTEPEASVQFEDPDSE